MLTTTDFLTYANWAGILTLACAAVTVLAFILKWGVRFRFVGATGFMGVLTTGLFALGLGLFIRTTIPGAIRYSLVFDNAATQLTIAVPPQVTETQLEATLHQAAADLFSSGRLGRPTESLTIRARTILHPEKGVSQPLYLGEVKRSLTQRNDQNLAIKIYSENVAQLPNSAA